MEERREALQKGVSLANNVDIVGMDGRVAIVVVGRHKGFWPLAAVMPSHRGTRHLFSILWNLGFL